MQVFIQDHFWYYGCFEVDKISRLKSFIFANHCTDDCRKTSISIMFLESYKEFKALAIADQIIRIKKLKFCFNYLRIGYRTKARSIDSSREC